MAAPAKLTRQDIETWARSFGLTGLKPEHLARMAELSVYVSDLCRNLPRPPRKEDEPAPTFLPPV